MQLQMTLTCSEGGQLQPVPPEVTPKDHFWECQSKLKQVITIKENIGDGAHHAQVAMGDMDAWIGEPACSLRAAFGAIAWWEWVWWKWEGQGVIGVRIVRIVQADYYLE